MCDGSLKPIQHVRAGEFVLSRSEETGEFGCREVVDPYSNPDKAIIRIELLAPDGGLEVIEATANHPFYVEGRGWTRVDELDTNDFVPGSTGELLRITALESTNRVETVFNFGVEEFHSYFVGELGAWVHNCIETVVDKILSGHRRSSGLKNDPMHRAASFLDRDQLLQGKYFQLKGGDGVERTLLQTHGVFNNRTGIFEYIIDIDDVITHQRFIPGGKITGHPNQIP